MQNGKHDNILTLDVHSILNGMINYMKYEGIVPIILMSILTIIGINKSKDIKYQILIGCMYMLILAFHIAFIIINRPAIRVVTSSYLIGIGCLMFFTCKPLHKEKVKKYKEILGIILCLLLSCFIFGKTVRVNGNHDIKNYKKYREVLEYTSSHKENVYLYTVLSMNSRYLAYSVYERIPPNMFDNIRAIGGWDVYTENYYNFKNRHKLNELLLELVEKDNVYLIDQNVREKGKYYSDYIEHIVVFLKDHYNINAEYEVVKEIGKIKIYKLNRID